MFVVSLSVRIALVVAQQELQLFDIAYDAADSVLYRSLAENLLEHGQYAQTLGHPTAYVTPGYPLFLAVLFTISDATLFVSLVQAAIGAATAVMLAAVASELAGRRAAWATGAIAAGYPHLLFWTGYVLTETLYVAAVSAALLATVWTLRSPDRLSRSLFTGVASGVAALVRPIFLGFALVLFVLAISSRWRKHAVVAACGLILTITPWVVRNAITMGSPIVTSTESGTVLWQGNSPAATGGTRGYVDGLDFRALEFPEGTGEVEKDRTYLERSLEWMRANPARVASLFPRKLWNMWRPSYEGASAKNLLVTYVTYPFLLVAGVAGLWVARQRGALAMVLVAFVVYHLIVHGLVTGMIRFRLPVEAVLTIPAGAFIAHIFERRAKAL